MTMMEETTPIPAAPRPPLPAVRLRTAAALALGALLLAVAGDPISTATGPDPTDSGSLWPGSLWPGPAGSTLDRIATAGGDADGSLQVGSADRLHRLFDRLGYDLDAVADGAAAVPPVELAALPADLGELEPVDRRKAVFIRAVLPIVIRANDAVLAERAGLEAVLVAVESGRPVPPGARGRIRRLAERYGLAGLAPDSQGIRRLLRRVDGVPVSLAVAQAISESGWGTSRFARAGNALFGQWTWTAGAGIVPAARSSGASHRVRAFRTLGDSARAYLLNLNTHPAYAGLRAARAAARRDAGRLPGGVDLAGHLTRYSERGEDYVRDIVTLIRQNRLSRLDRATLADPVRLAGRDDGQDDGQDDGREDG